MSLSTPNDENNFTSTSEQVQEILFDEADSTIKYILLIYLK